MVRAEGGSLRFWGPELLSTSPAFSMSSASHSAGSSGWLAQKKGAGPTFQWAGKERRMQPARGRFARFDLDRQIASTFPAHEALFCSIKADTPSSRIARIMTAAQGHPGDWITAYPIAQDGTRMDDKTLRISVAVRVSLNVCLAHQCCGATVQSDGLHPLSCRYTAGRLPRYSAINNIIKRSHDTAGLHSILEPVGHDRGDGRRPDGVTSFPFKGGKALALDATCTDSFSASNLYSTILNLGSASSADEDLKRQKYSQVVADFEFSPVAVETSGIIASAGYSLLTDIGRHKSRATNHLCQMSYIFQQISVAIIRGNALAITASSRRYAQGLVKRH